MSMRGPGGEPPYRPPQSTVQAAGQAASEIIGGLKQSPTLLAIVVLNVIGIAAALWFLNKIIDRARSNTVVLVEQMRQEGKSNRDLVDQCFIIARENQKDLRELREIEHRLRELELMRRRDKEDR